MPIGVPELLIVLAIVLLIFGPKRLPGLGRSLGAGIRNLKDGLRGDDDRPSLTDGPKPAEREDEALDGEAAPDRRP